MQYKWLKCTETVSLLCNGLAGMYKVDSFLLMLSDWSTYWHRTSQHYINNLSIIYSNVRIIIENLHKRNALCYLIFYDQEEPNGIFFFTLPYIF